MQRLPARFGFVALAALLLAVPSRAPARPAGEAVRLAFKFTAGAVTRYQLTGNEALGVRVREAPAGFPGMQPISGDFTLGINQKVTSVAPDGSANLKVNL